MKPLLIALGLLFSLSMNLYAEDSSEAVAKVEGANGLGQVDSSCDSISTKLEKDSALPAALNAEPVQQNGKAK